MATKEYNVVTRTRSARRRSERRGESVTGGSVSSQAVSVASGTGSENAGSGGSHSHSNKELLDSLQRDDEKYLYLRDWNSEGGEDGTGEYESEKVKAGYADKAGEADNSTKWNSKTMAEMLDQPMRTADDVTHKSVTATGTVKGKTLDGDLLTVVDSATVGGTMTAQQVATKIVVADSETDGTVMSSKEFDGTSALAGHGYGIMKEGNSYKMAIDYLTVRKGMTVAEVVIQEYKSIGGVLVLSRANGEIESVAKGDGYDYLVRIKDWERHPQIERDDYVRCSRWDDETNTYINYYLLVADTDITDGDGVAYVGLNKVSGYSEHLPQAGDNLVQWGNEHDPARQGLIIISVEDGKPNITAYDGITAPDVTVLPDCMKARLGDLSGLVKNGQALSGYGLWTNNLYLSDNATTQTFTQIIAGIGGAQSTADKALADIATASEDIATINKRLDGVVENWFVDGYPDIDSYPVTEWTTDNEKLSHLGDTFTNIQEYDNEITTPDAGKSWRWVSATTAPTNTEAYVAVIDNGVTKYLYWTPIADSDAVKALQEASKAQDTADGKKRVFVTTPYPPYDEGDLWVQGDDGDIMRCKTSKRVGEQYAASDWVKASKYTDDSAVETLRTEVESKFEATDTHLTSIQGQITTLSNNQQSMRTSIEQNAISIGLRATKEELAEETKRLDSSVNINAEGLTAVVSAMSSGGRNLLLNTNQGETGWSVYPPTGTGSALVLADAGNESDPNGQYIQGVAFERIDDSTDRFNFRFELRPWLVQEGQAMTLSFDIYQDNANGNETVFSPGLEIMTKGGVNSLLSEAVYPNGNEKTALGQWKRLAYTFTPVASGTAGSAQVVYLFVPGGTVWSTFRVCNMQLEYGEIATPWSEPMGDTEGKLSEIRQTADSISLKVKEKGVANINHAIGTQDAYTKTSDWDSANANKTHRLYDVTGFKTGDRVTVSFDWEWKSLDWTQNESQVFVTLSGEYGWLSTGFSLTAPATGTTGASGHHTGTMTIGKVSSTGADATEQTVAFIYVGFKYINGTDGTSSFSISNLKVESGDTETAWTARTDDLETAMVETGIDISNRKIVAKADTFEVRNNNGDVTARVDASGRLSSNVFHANSEESENPLVTINENFDGYARWYYPDTKIPCIEIGWDSAQDSVFRVYDANGTMVWKLGMSQSFMQPNANIWSAEVMHAFDSEASEEDVENMAKSPHALNPTITIYRYAQVGNIIYCSVNGDPTTTINGWYTRNIDATQIDGGKYWRQILRFQDGKVVESQDVIWS